MRQAMPLQVVPPGTQVADLTVRNTGHDAIHDLVGHVFGQAYFQPDTVFIEPWNAAQNACTLTLNQRAAHEQRIPAMDGDIQYQPGEAGS